MLLGVDTGGTFTDFVFFDGKGLRFHKTLSTPDDPARAILEGIEDMGLDAGNLHIVHGSTVATNAILERKGVKTLFVTNKGFEDLLLIGRQTRRELYNLQPAPPAHLLEHEDCIGISGRVDTSGQMIEALDPADTAAIAAKSKGYQAVACCTLFSFLNPEQEQAVAEVLPNELFVSLSHRILPEYREYERAATTFLNAYVGPLVETYLSRLADQLSARHLFVMHSAGGIMAVEQAGRQAVRLILSGPAGGLVAARQVGAQLDEMRLMSFDMGGTSTDVALIEGEPGITIEGAIADMPVAVPMLDIHTIGAGGGSMAWLDEASLLHVGPESAGANPGPICYGRGGSRVTVTDANLTLGRLPDNARLAGSMPLEVESARTAMARQASEMGLSPEKLAEGILAVAEENMAAALRVVSVQRGHDPRKFSLMCFGGAGGLHACALADKLGIKRIILPLASGAFSALGMLTGQRQGDFSRTRQLPLADHSTLHQTETIYAELKAQARAAMPNLTLNRSRYADICYQGQGFHLTLPFDDDLQALAEAFHAAHEKAYGHVLDQPVDLITLRLTATADTPTVTLPETARAASGIEPCDQSHVHKAGLVPHYRRAELQCGHELSGPALVLEDTATLWLARGWALSVSPHGHLLLRKL
ncbi:MAG: hydantoinase/oxoprolinase family protein [Mariprofundaceae bacterium]